MKDTDSHFLVSEITLCGVPSAATDCNCYVPEVGMTDEETPELSRRPKDGRLE